MVNLKEIIAGHQDWLVDRLIEIAKNQGYTQDSSTIEEGWRITVTGLSKSLITELERRSEIAEFRQGNLSSDPISAFGIKEARLHRSRGVPLNWFMGGLKCSRRAFSDLIKEIAGQDELQLEYLRALDRFFDRVELGIVFEMANVDKEIVVAEMQDRNRELTNKKNKYLTICESLANPIFLLDEYHQLQWMNCAAGDLLEEMGFPRFAYHSDKAQIQAPDWLTRAALDLTQSGRDSEQYPLDLEVSSRAQHFRLKVSRMADVSDNLPGTIAIMSNLTDYQKALDGASRYQILARRMTDVILILNKDGKILEANDAASQVFAISGQEMQALTIHDLLLPSRYSQVSIHFTQLQKEPLAFETEMCRRDGTCFPVEISAEAAQLGEEQVFACIIRDISERTQAKSELQAAYAELDQIFTSVPEGMVAISPDYTITRVNKMFGTMMGRKPSELVGCKCYDLIKTPECHTPKCTLKLIAEGASILEREMGLASDDGVRHCHLVTSAPLRNADGTFAGMVETLKEITERKKAEEELKNYRLLFQQAHDVILFISLDGSILDGNEAAVKTYGYCRDELLNLTIVDLQLPGGEKGHRLEMGQAYENGIMLETVHRCKDGSFFPVEVSARGVTINGEKALVSIIRNITERKQAEKEIHYLSFHDKLTGLYNRAYLEEKLKNLPRNGVPCSIIMGDLNGLKVANDAFGHEAGDKLLLEIARILRSACRADDIIARVGGDEFVILLPNTTEDAALSVLERIREKCKDSILQPIQPSISLGVATKTSPEQDVFRVLQDAESRMYRRKLLEADSARSFSIQSLQRSLHEKSCETEEHTIRLRTLISRLAEEMELPSSMLDDLDLLAALHDIGKIAIPDDILNKPGSLTAEEFEVMKRHSEIGYRIARTSPQLASIADCVLAHHERWDGSGYPQGLAGEKIPLAARVLAVVDAYDAMTHDRPYKRAIDIVKAIRELRNNAGTQFDPNVVSAFISLLEEEVTSVGA